MTPVKQDLMLRLFKEMEPLKKSLASRGENLNQYGIFYDDIMGFMDDKIIHVWTKYPDKPFDELKGLCIASLYRVIPRLIRTYKREVLVEEIESFKQEEEKPSLAILLHSLSRILDKNSLELAELIIDPPHYILNKVSKSIIKIPSTLFLEFLDIPITSYNVRKFNRFRRDLFGVIREKIDPQTLTPINA